MSKEKAARIANSDNENKGGKNKKYEKVEGRTVRQGKRS